jgi:hypothetical protein
MGIAVVGGAVEGAEVGAGSRSAEAAGAGELLLRTTRSVVCEDRWEVDVVIPQPDSATRAARTTTRTAVGTARTGRGRRAAGGWRWSVGVTRGIAAP